MNCTPRVPLAVLFACFASCPTAHAQEGPLREVVKKLHAIELKEEDAPFYEVPPTARKLLPQLKAGIREAVLEIVSNGGPNGSPQSFRQKILSQLSGKGLELEQSDNGGYGHFRKLEVQTPDGHPELISVKTAISIACGEDSSLYVFQRSARSWRLLMSIETGGYDKVNGALENLDYRISPPDEHNQWFAVVVYSHPWCTSCWGGLHYRVLRPSAKPGNPRVIHEAKLGFYRCADKAYRLSVGKQHFSLSYPDMMVRDFDLFARVSVDRYRIDGDSVQRLAPRSQPPVSFVDQWINSTETDATEMATSRAKEEALKWHRKLAVLHEESSLRTGYEFMQECPTKELTWQVALSIQEDALKEGRELPQYVYFKLAQTKDGVVLTGVSDKRDSTCPGDGQRPVRVDINNVFLPD